MVNFSEFAKNTMKPFHKSDTLVHEESINAAIAVNLTKPEDTFAATTRNASHNRTAVGTAVGITCLGPYGLVLGPYYAIMRRELKNVEFQKLGTALLTKIANGSDKLYVSQIGSKLSKKRAEKVVIAKNVSVQQRLAQHQLNDEHPELLQLFGQKSLSTLSPESAYTVAFKPSSRKVFEVQTTRQEASRLLAENSHILGKDNDGAILNGVIAEKMARLQQEELKLHMAIGKEGPTPAQVDQQGRLFRTYKELQSKKIDIPESQNAGTVASCVKRMKQIQREDSALAKSILKKRVSTSTIQKLQKEELQKEYEALQTEKQRLEEAAAGTFKQGTPLFSRKAQRSEKKSTWFKSSPKKEAPLGTDFDSEYEALLPESSDLEKQETGKKPSKFSFKSRSNQAAPY